MITDLFEIKTFRCLPCHTKKFTIKGIDADTDDFGDCDSDGSCMNNTCRNKFIPKLPENDVLKKYDINLAEYKEICDALEEELFVCGCGWCS